MDVETVALAKEDASSFIPFSFSVPLKDSWEPKRYEDAVRRKDISLSVPESPSMSPDLYLVPQSGDSSQNIESHGTSELIVDSWTEQKEKVVRAPFDYLAAGPGKGFRTKLLVCFNTWLHVSQESLEIITNVIHILHTASLLVDDVQDNSVLRRGRPVAQSVFGVAQTINSANYAYFLALEELNKLNNSKAVGIFTEELLCLHRGQGMDLFWRVCAIHHEILPRLVHKLTFRANQDTLTCPKENEYLEMVSNKTGGLFRLAVKLMQAESAMHVDLVPLVDMMGIAFQIGDDYKNLRSDDYGEKKGFAEDLSEGKFSFPVIHSMHTDLENVQLLHILQQKPTADEIKRYAIQYIESTGSFAYTRSYVDTLLWRAAEEVRRLDPEGEKGEKGKTMYSLLNQMAIH